jgi:N-carbamoylputrescine amidase
LSGVVAGVCETPAELQPGSAAWQDLGARARRAAPALFLLPELPFGPWVGADDAFEPGAWRETCRLHAEGGRSLDELGAAVAATTLPQEDGGRRVNQATLWTASGGLRGVHTKQHFPDEPGYFEARWFEPGPRHFRVAQAGALRVGFLICTEVMFNEHARRYGRSGAQVLLVPRAVGAASLRRWLVAMRMAAIVSGCYVMSSNRAGADSRGQEFGGRGWIVDPLGDVVAETSAAQPLAFHALDLELVARAQAEYPCYIRE